MCLYILSCAVQILIQIKRPTHYYNTMYTQLSIILAVIATAALLLTPILYFIYVRYFNNLYACTVVRIL